jgi:hypothetical protein
MQCWLVNVYHLVITKWVQNLARDLEITSNNHAHITKNHHDLFRSSQNETWTARSTDMQTAHTNWGVKLLYFEARRLPSSWIWNNAVLQRHTNVSEEYASPLFSLGNFYTQFQYTFIKKNIMNTTASTDGQTKSKKVYLRQTTWITGSCNFLTRTQIQFLILYHNLITIMNLWSL